MAFDPVAAPRLFVEDDLRPGVALSPGGTSGNYLVHVLRLGIGGTVRVFNGRDGEWRAEIAAIRKATVTLTVADRLAAQTPPPDLWYLFAPLKHARLDYMVQKAVEMGAGVLQPVITRRTQVARVNLDRMRANAVEAAEQCGLLGVPDVRAETTLDRALSDWPADRALVVCDEDAPMGDPAGALAAARGCRLAVLIGPEGGFEEMERRALLELPQVLRLSLGPRILRADTAAVAALAVIQATIGDWVGS